MADLRFSADEADEVERAAVDTVLGDGVIRVESERLVRGGERSRRAQRHLLLPALHALQAAKGWISPGGLGLVAERLQVPPAEAHGVATFYDLFRDEPPNHRGGICHVCVDPACLIAGAGELATRLAGQGRDVHESACLGQCERAPGLFVQGVGSADVVPADSQPELIPQAGEAGLRLLRRIGVVDPDSLDSYRSEGGYGALRAAIQLGPAAVIEQVTASGLSGRGGAAFPTGVKWKAVAEQDAAVKYVVANADESEPGTFKDRVLIEGDPFALVEALTIAGFATGAEQGWVYVRGEYPRATARLHGAIEQARAAGLLGDDAAGSGHRFDIEVRRGAGAYVCGEETALFNSIEGFRGEPRNKPPFPTTRGLFGAPTAVNNPETLVNVLTVLTEGVDRYRSLGTEGSPGTRLLCLSGRVERPGVYEVPFGITLGAAIDLAGGPSGELRAVLLGGAAGSFVGPEQLDLPLTLEDTRAAGVTLGSGVVMLFDDSVDMSAVVTRIARFFRDESCGQCVPCRLGTVRQHELVVRAAHDGEFAESRRDLLDDLGLAMGDASICGLGHTASSAVRSAVALGLIGEPPDSEETP